MNTKPTALLIAFADAPYSHWAPRFDDAFGGNVDRIPVPAIAEDGTVSALPTEREGTVLLVNARVAAALTTAFRKVLVSPCGRLHAVQMTRRNDLYVLPQGAPQDGSAVDLDFLVKVE